MYQEAGVNRAFFCELGASFSQKKCEIFEFFQNVKFFFHSSMVLHRLMREFFNKMLKGFTNTAANKR